MMMEHDLRLVEHKVCNGDDELPGMAVNATTMMASYLEPGCSYFMLNNVPAGTADTYDDMADLMWDLSIHGSPGAQAVVLHHDAINHYIRAQVWEVVRRG